jgi:hypothetical protein
VEVWVEEFRWQRNVVRVKNGGELLSLECKQSPAMGQ